MLGHQQVGSFALSSDKTEMFSVAIGAFLDIICETFNSQGIPQLIDLNGIHFEGITDYPQLAHGEVEDVDITKLSTYIKDMTGVGIIIPDEELEDYVRKVAKLPERTNDREDYREKNPKREEQRRKPEEEKVSPDEAEEHLEEKAEEAKKRLGR